MADDADVKDELDISPETAEESGEDPFESLENDTTSWGDESKESEETAEQSIASEPAEDEPTEKPEDELEEESVKETESEEPEKEEADEESESEEEDTTSEGKPSKEEQKRLNDEAAKRRIAERALRDERDAREKENLNRYLEEAQDDDVELAKRQTEVERHLIQKERIGLNADKLDVGIRRFAAESELLKSGDKVVQEAIADALDDFEAMYVVKDNAGNPVEVKADVYQYLQKKADSINKLTGIGARQQTKQKANEKTRTVTRPTRTPKESAKDPDIEAFNKAFYGE